MCAVLSLAFLSTSCLGSFSAWNGLRDWNESVADNKFVNNAIFWGLNIIPVYPLFYAGDVIIFNLVEFWSGSNPIAMNDGDIESQIIEKDGVKYEMIATKNQINIRVLTGEREGNELTLIYEASDKSWNAMKDGEKIKLSSYEEGFYIVYLPDGEEVKIDQNATRQEGLALLNSKVASYENCLLASAK
ncbi:membrane protein [Salinimicrobium marinum]|uniref:Membrane protein n=2 Tax=Salinimicrobium marinum TaxID=680283 RepID=A0A918SHZ9_9FLAO|nr:membrane protein [Salinimicrobium marinum]